MPDTQKRAAEQQDAVSRLELQAEQAIASIPATYASRSSLIADIQGAVASARAAARSGNAIDLSALKQLIDKAQDVGKETTQRQTSHQYAEGTIALSQDALRRIDIASRPITDENLREHIDSIVDPDKEMDEQTRKRIADGVEAGMRKSPEAQAQLAIHNHFDAVTLRTTSTMQEQGRADIQTMINNAQTPQAQAAAQRAKNSEIHTTREGLELLGKRKAGEISDEQLDRGIEQIEERKAQHAEAHRHEIFSAIPDDRRKVLANMGLGDSAESLNLTELLHRNGTMQRNAGDFAMLREKGFANLPPEVQERLAVREAAKHALMYSSLYDFNELALFVVKSKEQEQTLTPKDKALIEKFNRMTDPATPQKEREDIAIALFKDKNPNLFKSVENNPEFQRNAAAAILKTFDENRDKFGIKDNPHLVALEQAASRDVTARFAIGMDAMLAGDAKATEDAAKDAAEGLAEKAKAFGLSSDAVQTIQDASHTVLSGMGSAAVNVVQTYHSFFGSDPSFNAEIQQQLAQMGPELAALRDAQGNALNLKDADGKIDMAKVTEALKEKGIALKDVDKDASGDITGKELLTALGVQRQSENLLAKS